MIGGNLPSSDAWTTSLLTNADVLAIDQHATSARAVLTTDKVVVWTANAATADLQYLAFFNLTEQTTTLQYSWHQLGFSESRYWLRDLWEHRDLGTATSLSVTIPAHGVTLYGLAGARRDQGAVSRPLNQSVSALQPRSVGRKP
jgi:alpha-galactosidase